MKVTIRLVTEKLMEDTPNFGDRQTETTSELVIETTDEALGDKAYQWMLQLVRQSAAEFVKQSRKTDEPGQPGLPERSE